MDLYPVLTSTRFILLWILGSLLAMALTLVTACLTLLGLLVVVGLYLLSGGGTLNSVTYALALASCGFIGAVMGFTTGAIQRALMHQKFRRRFRGWRTASTLGGLVGCLLSGAALSVPLKHALSTLVLPGKEALFAYVAISLIIPLTCLGIAQWFILQRYVHGAWAWILANAVAGIVFFSLLVALITSGAAALPALVLAVSAAPAVVTGFALLWLFHFNGRSLYPEDFS